MRELTMNEVQDVSGGGWITEYVKDLTVAYELAIGLATDVMCRVSGNC